MVNIKTFIAVCIIFVLFLSACSMNNIKEDNVPATSIEAKTSVSANSLNSNIELAENSVNDKNPIVSTEAEISKNDNLSNNRFEFSKGSFSEKDIKELFRLKRAEIESLIGTDYEISQTGAEQSLTAYTYKKHDVSIFYTMYDTMDDYIDFIDCGNTINIFGLHIGMTFEEIKEVIPNAAIRKWSPEEDDEIVYYEIECTKDEVIISFTIKSEESPSTSMSIHRKRD